jgi:hypothetical protein
MSSLWKKFDRFPPLVVRLLARKKLRGRVVAMTDHDISVASGLSAAWVKYLSWSLTWDDVPVLIARDFMRGCGVDFGDAEAMRNHTRYLKTKGRFDYLKRSPDWPSFKQLIDHGANEWRKSGVGKEPGNAG